MGENFPMPESRDDIFISNFRLPYHKVADQSNEQQNWFNVQNIKYKESMEADRVVAVDEPGDIFPSSHVVAPSHFMLYINIPTRLYPQNKLSSRVISLIKNPSHIGLNALVQDGREIGLAFWNWLIQTHTKSGDKVMDPFCGNGASAVASILNERDFIGVEYNRDRARSAQLACEEITKLTS